jgi:hypothetical protein
MTTRSICKMRVMKKIFNFHLVPRPSYSSG